MEDWEVRMMRRFRQGGWTHAELSFFFEVSQAVVSRTCRGKAYKDAGGPIEQVRQKASRSLHWAA